MPILIILSDLENCKGFESTFMSHECENHSVHEGCAVLPISDVLADFPGEDFDLMADHEGGVKSDAELADETRRVQSLGALFLQECTRPGTSDRP